MHKIKTDFGIIYAQNKVKDLTHEQKVTLSIRPESIQAAKNQTEDKMNTFPFTIKERTYLEKVSS